MGELVNFEISRLPKLKLVGKELRYNMEAHMKGDNRIPAFWDKGDGDFSYIAGMLMKEGAAVPDGYCSRELEETEAAIGWVRGKNVADVCSCAHLLTENAVKEKGYSCDQMKWCMELYNCPRFTAPDENGDIILDYYIPVSSR